MSFDRRFLSRLRLRSALAIVLLSAVSAQADDTWHNVFHSLKRFFTGKPSSTPIVHHRSKRSLEREKTGPSTEPAESPAVSTSSPGASATPRVVILPSTSPTAEASPGAVNSVRTPEEAVKPTPSPELGPILRSLAGPTPVSNPGVVPSPTPAAGNTTVN
jgi:hypothetical protein